MSKITIYAFIMCYSLSMAFAVESTAQRKMLNEIAIHLDSKEVKLVDLIKEIEQSTNFVFAFSKGDIKDKTIHLEESDWLMNELLQEISVQGHLSFRRVNESINIREVRVTSSLPDVVETVDLQQSISGKVTDENGESLPGATILEKGTTNGTITDVDGNFNISVPDAATLQISFVGYSTKEVTATQNLEISLTPDFGSLDEVVVVGYGSVKKSDLTGSVVSVDTKDLEGMPVVSFDQSLVGRAAGVQVSSNTGMPGAIAKVRIRGANSIQGGNEPLYVIDGFPVYQGSGFGGSPNSETSATGFGVNFSGLASLNPNDIESIEVLKDASATSIYGSRGANGVILITTKNGKSGQDKITFDSYVGTAQVVNNIDMMSALEYATLINEASVNASITPPYDAGELAEIQANPEGTDWQDEIYRVAVLQNYQISASGGDQKGTYFLSGNYMDQDGTVIGVNSKRYSTRLNLRRNIMSNVKVGLNSNISRFSAKNGDLAAAVRGALLMNPAQPVFEDIANGIYTFNNSPGATNLGNPVASALAEKRRTINDRVIGNLFAEWEITPGLRFKSSIGIDLQNIKVDIYAPSFLLQVTGGSEATSRGRTILSWVNENTLTYSKQVGDHSFTVLGGITAQEESNQYFMAQNNTFVTDRLNWYDLGGGINPAVTSDFDKWSILSYLGRVNYAFQGKYLLTGAIRVDGSSRFGPENKYASFPSGAFKWRLSEEDFIKSVSAITDLGLRVSYGVTGNTNFDPYQSIALLDNAEVNLERRVAIGFFPDNIANPDLRWEKTGQFNVGLDVGVFNNRMRLTADYYNKQTTDLLYTLQVPQSTGYNTVLQNIGGVENKGVEFSIFSDNVRIPDFIWSSSFNIAFNRNKVTSLGPDPYKFVGQGSNFAGDYRRLEVGAPIVQFWGYVYDGLFRDQTELDAGPSNPGNRLGGPRLKDLSGPDGSAPDGAITPDDDKTVIGDPNPDFYGGFTNNLSFKGFEASIFLQYMYGNDIFNDTRASLANTDGNQNALAAAVDRWTPENQDAEYPSSSRNLSGIFHSGWIEDGSYLKLRTLTLAYSFPNLNAEHISGLRVTLSGQNLLTFTKYTGFDPEVSKSGTSDVNAGEDSNTYPQNRIFQLGIKFDLK